MEEHLGDLGVGSDFLNIQKTLIIKSKKLIDWSNLKFKNFC